MTHRTLLALAALGAVFLTAPVNAAADRDNAGNDAADNVVDDTVADDAIAKIDNRFDFEHVSCNGAENEIRVIVTGVKQSAGLIVADMYPNNQEVFLRGRGRIKKVKYAARTPETKFCVPAPETGLFAMAIYHDRNANGDFDKNGLGLPAEPWGLSNNPRGLFGPPKVERTLFEVRAEGAEVEIELN